MMVLITSDCPHIGAEILVSFCAPFFYQGTDGNTLTGCPSLK
ncbi:MAG: hypothetical protein WC749_04035 [Dehalococcoidia bacterium]